MRDVTPPEEDGFIDKLKKHIRAVALTAAGVIVVLQLVTPSVLDGVFSVVLIGCGWVAAKAHL